MNASLLMNCLWYEDIEPEDLAAELEITPETLFEKLFGPDEFSLAEIRKITAFVGLTVEEVNTIFFDGLGCDGTGADPSTTACGGGPPPLGRGGSADGSV